ncbi:Na+/H+ antiporter subunit D [Mangrovibacillus cuniculi]|uniref:Na+/H+ antiporter subunit D n=1 Tax=Mangrovibacillus cuniculi TaxID=2593652 RepID=A0A7S8CEG5_9BACI|nr:Na+/H+ antiporter subunit D [Mangrovibacillus cuniculi]QPC48432.1 Na+/H+ antiporter subunit D [Mangrovibacillus cuniculi]
MTNLPVYPILIPLLAATALLFFPKKIKAQRFIAAVTSGLTLLASLYLLLQVHAEDTRTLDLGSWPAPFGITLVSDIFSALLVTTTSFIVFSLIIYSFKMIGRDREGFYYYPAMMFLLVGVNGAFTTGDIFNLFVFFEVFLMASYVMIVLGGTKGQLRESFKYILINVLSSALFVIAIGYLYSVTGSLNMADISARLASIEPVGLITVIGVLFLIVFGLKGAIFPLYFWMPSSYAAPPIPVLAVFGALLTKVGVYSIARTFSLFFPENEFLFSLLSLLALLTIVVGVIGAVAYWDVKQIIIYNVMIAVGVILFGFATQTEAGVEGAVFYLIHDMIIKAGLFMLIGMLILITGTSNLKKMSGTIKQFPLVGWLYFIAALSLAGIPPLSGFIGKLLIIRGGFEAEEFVGSGLILLSSLLVLYSVMKIFLNGIWGKPEEYRPKVTPNSPSIMIPTIIIVFAAIMYGFGAEGLHSFMNEAAQQMLNPENYQNAVLKE